MNIDKLLARYRVEQGKHFRLKDYDPADTHGLGSELKPQAKELLDDGIKEMSQLQDILAAQDRWGLLLIFQAMDAAGKDGTIKHVMSGVNPQGVQVWSFKTPSEEELHHGFLWRTQKVMPERGKIGIFNRSYYEEVLVVRVHPEINCSERYATRNGIAVLKFFLHLSKKEQKRRFMARLDTPDKNWKFSAPDIKERQFWDQYQDAYEEMIQHTATEYAPWYVVPADNKWFTRIVVAQAVVDALKGMKLKYPKVTSEEKAALAAARKQLESE